MPDGPAATVRETSSTAVTGPDFTRRSPSTSPRRCGRHPGIQVLSQCWQARAPAV